MSATRLFPDYEHLRVVVVRGRRAEVGRSGDDDRVSAQGIHQLELRMDVAHVVVEAMTTTGHKARAVFDRYHIVSPAHLRDLLSRGSGVRVPPGAPPFTEWLHRSRHSPRQPTARLSELREGGGEGARERPPRGRTGRPCWVPERQRCSQPKTPRWSRS